MSLLRRDEFLAWGLTPRPDLEGQGQCPICIEEVYTRPVATPCNHVYCAECLVNWLKTTDHCPMCRRELFDKDAEGGIFIADDDDAVSVDFGPIYSDDEENEQEDRLAELEANVRAREVDWPVGIEPFQLQEQFGLPYEDDTVLHNERAVAWGIICFDSYRFEMEAFGYHPLIDRHPQHHKVRILAKGLTINATAAVYRISSDPNLDLNSAGDVYIHTLCRAQWVAVVHRLSATLKTIEEREQAREARQWVGLNAFDLRAELRMALHEFPQMANDLDVEQREALMRSAEVRRFRDGVDELVRWVVTEAFISFKEDEHDPDFDREAWWEGLADI